MVILAIAPSRTGVVEFWQTYLKYSHGIENCRVMLHRNNNRQSVFLSLP